MKVETPQILWNSEGDTGKNAPLYSISMQESGVTENGHVLATAGNTNIINLWKISFDNGSGGEQQQQQQQLFHKDRKLMNKIDYMTSLARHERPVNSVAFSPDGLHLATAGEAGNIIIWSVPVSKRGNGNGKHFWSTIDSGKDLTVKIVSTHCEGVCDLSWSADSKRFMVGSIDSHVLVWEDKQYAHNVASHESQQKESEWQSVFRSGEHTSFVQGVSYDPLGVYLASMGSDRTCRLFPRKIPPKSKKKVLRPSNSTTTTSSSSSRISSCEPPAEHQQMVSQLLTETKVEIGKTKRIKQRTTATDPETGAQTKQRLFVDESTCESFFRRLSWTTDGMYLVTPAALWHNDGGNDDGSGEGESSSSSPSFATYLFARHKFDEPCKVLPGLDKPSVVVRPNPVLFELPTTAATGSDKSKEHDGSEESKENESPTRKGNRNSNNKLPYRSVFAVMTLDSILVYDTHHSHPLSIVRGLHYTGLTDCCWSKDGHSLVVCSTDGYLSIINFGPNELGKVYQPPQPQEQQQQQQQTLPLPPVKRVPSPTASPLPPCRPGPTVLESRPTKKTRITPTLISTTTPNDDETKKTTSSPTSTTSAMMIAATTTRSPTTAHKRSAPPETEEVGDAVNKLSLGSRLQAAETGGEKPKKKKKRIQPMLIST
eukprot:CAMPEP_0113643808 /NCGR_PEP_ID=MMETSP0017_2-20120614/23045_1 /TAXON_ID=2856 /ORGANISM="Cylindrotheca closterium" /LENGTH=655 /DNA_ID=CAMNT_0000555363 /DNA_START=136 /DNA_END=2106 /DNA_ORIENTATION=- /assembly_acc=CAM_ASM_000147